MKYSLYGSGILCKYLANGFLGFFDKASKQSTSKQKIVGINAASGPILYAAKDKPVVLLKMTKRSRGHMGRLSSAFASYS